MVFNKPSRRFLPKANPLNLLGDRTCFGESDAPANRLVRADIIYTPRNSSTKKALNFIPAAFSEFGKSKHDFATQPSRSMGQAEPGNGFWTSVITMSREREPERAGG